METIVETDVIIVGAGPTGLSLACQFVRYGVDFAIVEKNEGVTRYSKAIGVHARTLEIYEQLGLAQRAVEQGSVAGKVRLLEGGAVRGEVNLSNVGQGLSPYPYLLILEQNKNEQLLYEFLLSQGKDVLWRTELESFSQDDSGVTARVKTPGGESKIVKAKYLVGCDGAKSFVRRGLGLTFEGSTFERLFYVADARIDWDFSHDALHVCLAQSSLVAFFPMKGEKRYRIVGTFPEGTDKEEGEVLYEEIEQRIKDEAKIALDISHVNWFSTYKVHTRRVNKFSEGRCFVAGDAAHVHSPAGAQGMNTGIQDAYNLAWKMAFVIQGRADEKLLETYNEERLENAKRLLKTTDRMFDLAAGPGWLVSFIRTTIIPPLAEFILSFDVVKKLIFPLVSQIGITYHDCSLSDHAGDGDFKVKAGDRMPYFLIEGGSVYDLLRAPKFHLLVFSDGQTGHDATRAEIESEFANLVDSHVAPLRPRASEVFGVNKSFQVLLRPDNYIAFISPETSSDRLRAYLNERAGVDRQADFSGE